MRNFDVIFDKFHTEPLSCFSLNMKSVILIVYDNTIPDKNKANFQVVHRKFFYFPATNNKNWG